MKRFVCLLLVLILLAAPAGALAEFNYESLLTPRLLVMDVDSGTVFYERAADEKAFPASTTKIMTCILALENGDLDEQITVGNEVKGTIIEFTKYSSLMGLVPGETVTLRDLLYGLMLVSGNDAAEAIAFHLAGSIDAFSAMMNAKAAELGMTHTHFANPHGVQNENHYTTARDMALLTAYALENASFREIVSAQSYTVAANNLRAEALTVNNTNRLLRMQTGDTESCVYPYAIGVKTGDTSAAGKCLVAAAQRDGATIVIVSYGDTAELYGGDNDAANLARFKNAAAIFTDLFDTRYTTVDASQLGLDSAVTVPVLSASEEDLTDGSLTVPVELGGKTLRMLPELADALKNGSASLTVKVTPREGLSAPIAQGDFVGRAEYLFNGKVLFSTDLLSPSDVRLSVGVIPSSDAPASTDPGSQVTVSPGETPLIRRTLNIGFMGWILIILIILFIALIVVFIISEKNRRLREAGRKRHPYPSGRKRRS